MRGNRVLARPREARAAGIGESARQRLAKRQVQLRRPWCAVPVKVPGRSGEHLPGEGSGGIRPCATRLRRRHIAGIANGRPEHSGLHGGLVRTDAARFRWPVGGEQDERNPRVVRLEHGGVQVRDRGSRRAGDGDRHPRLDRETQGEKTRVTFVNAHVQANASGRFQMYGRKRECLRARPWADDDIAHAELREAAQQRQ